MPYKVVGEQLAKGRAWGTIVAGKRSLKSIKDEYLQMCVFREIQQKVRRIFLFLL